MQVADAQQRMLDQLTVVVQPHQRLDCSARLVTRRVRLRRERAQIVACVAERESSRRSCINTLRAMKPPAVYAARTVSDRSACHDWLQPTTRATRRHV